MMTPKINILEMWISVSSLIDISFGLSTKTGKKKKNTNILDMFTTVSSLNFKDDEQKLNVSGNVDYSKLF